MKGERRADIAREHVRHVLWPYPALVGLKKSYGVVLYLSKGPAGRMNASEGGGSGRPQAFNEHEEAHE